MVACRHSGLESSITFRRCHFLASAMVVMALVLPAGLQLFAGPEDDKLAMVKEAYVKGLGEAKGAVVTTYRDEIARLSEKKMTDPAKRTQDEMEYFQKTGILLPRTELIKAFMTYGASQKKLGDELAEAYVNAANAAAKAGDNARADALRRELADRRLPGKLSSIRLFRSNGFMMHGDYKGIVKLAPTIGEQFNATFEIVNGLSESGWISFRSASVPNHYFAHGNFRLHLSPYQDNDGYRQNATFKKVKGLGLPTGVSFESVNFPDHYIRVRKGQGKGELWVDRETPRDGSFKADATFSIIEPLVKLW